MQPPLSRFRWPHLTDANAHERSKAFGYRRSATHTHRGVDLGSRAGTPVWAVADGVIEQSQDMQRTEFTQGFDTYGSVVVLRLGDGRRVLYAHLDSRTVEPGQHVVEGQQLGTVGTTRGDHANPGRRFGNSGAHLHFELADRPYPMDPEADRLDPEEFNMPAPDAPARDSIDRWKKLDGLIHELFEAIPPEAITPEHQQMLAEWQAAYEFAPHMGPGLRASAISDWVAKYNFARDQAAANGLTVPPKINDVGVIPDVVRKVEETVDEAKSGFGFGLALLALLLIWNMDKAREVVSDR